jgi:hypothetical protein
VASGLATPRSTRGQITLIAGTYAVYGLALAMACIAGARIGPIQLSPADAFLPGLLIVAAVGAMLRRPWGRYLCYAFSLLLLPAAPLGTIMGGLMIYRLTVHRDQFRRPLSNPNGDR